jgi:glycosyltransferase involved in cell wall biosynthesis
MKPLIAIPTFNEAKNVADVIASVKSIVPDILIIDDASTDATPAILDSISGLHVIRHKTNMGYGQALIDAFEFASDRRFDWVITMDADGQHEAESIPEFLREASTGDWDLISGSRYLAARGDDDLPPPERRSVNHRVTKILNNLFGMELTDSFCGFKAHRTAAMLDMNLTEAGYAFPLQLWPRVWEYRLRMKEIPVRRIYNDPNRSFGAHLDDADRRLRHYIDVLNRELVRLNASPVEIEPAPAKPRMGCGC